MSLEAFKAKAENENVEIALENNSSINSFNDESIFIEQIIQASFL